MSQSKMTLEVNGHSLSGKKTRQKWKFVCPSFPQVEEHTNLDDAVSEFMGLVLQPLVEIKASIASETSRHP